MDHLADAADIVSHGPAASNERDPNSSCTQQRNSIFDKIVNYLREFSFSIELFSTGLVASLVAVLSIVNRAITENVHATDKKPITIALLYQVTASCFGKSVKKLSVNDEKRLIFEGAFILLVSQNLKCITYSHEKLFYDLRALFEAYPEFNETAVDSIEIGKLLKFRNTMALCILLIPANAHKNHLLDLCTRLSEGKSASRYTRGSGQSDSTSRRVLIYRREGNIPLVCRGPRQSNVDSTTPQVQCFVEELLMRCGTQSPHNTQLVDSCVSDSKPCEGLMACPPYTACEVDDDTLDEGETDASRVNSDESVGESILHLGLDFLKMNCSFGTAKPSTATTHAHIQMDKRRHRHQNYLNESLMKRRESLANGRTSPEVTASARKPVQSFEAVIQLPDGSTTTQFLHGVISLRPIRN